MPIDAELVAYLNERFLPAMWPFVQDFLSNQIIHSAYWDTEASEGCGLDIPDTTLDMDALPAFRVGDAGTLLARFPGNGVYALKTEISTVIDVGLQIDFSLEFDITNAASNGVPDVVVHTNRPLIGEGKARDIRDGVLSHLDTEKPLRFFESLRWDPAAPVLPDALPLELVAGFTELDNRNAIDIFLVADGYERNDLPDFDALAVEVATKLRTPDPATQVPEPYASFQSAVRVWKIRNYTGDRNDRLQRVVVSYDDPMTATTKSSLSSLSRLARVGLFARAAGADAVVFLSKSQPGILGDQARAISFGGVVLLPVSSSSTTVATTLVHELGHIFGGLADEYEESDPVHQGQFYKAKEPQNANVTTLRTVLLTPEELNDAPASIRTAFEFPLKWAFWSDRGALVSQGPRAGTPVPRGGLVGGYYFHKGILRPTENCKMRLADSEVPFCPVCREAITDGLRAALIGSSALIEYTYLAPERVPGVAPDWTGPVSRFFVRSDGNHVDSDDLLAFRIDPPMRVRLRLLASSLPEDWQVTWRRVSPDGRATPISQGSAFVTDIQPGSRIELRVASTCDYTPRHPFPASEVFINVGERALVSTQPRGLRQADPRGAAIPIGGAIPLAYDPTSGLAITPQVALSAIPGDAGGWPFLPANLEFRINGPSQQSRRFYGYRSGSTVTFLPNTLRPGDYQWEVIAFDENQMSQPASLPLNGGRFHFQVVQKLVGKRVPPHDPVSLYVGAPILLRGRRMANTIELGASSFDLDGDAVRLEFEVKPVDQNFDGQPTHQTPLMNPTFDSLRVTGAIEVPSTLDVEFSKWQVRAVDAKDQRSGWVRGQDFSTYQPPVDLIPPFDDPRVADFAGRIAQMMGGDFRSVVILASSTIEAALLDRLQRNPGLAMSSRFSLQQADISQWGLNRLIEVSVDLGLVSRRFAALPPAIRQYRTLMDTSRAAHDKMKIGSEEVRAALGALQYLAHVNLPVRGGPVP
jgi:hypothetical protein